MQCKGGMHPSVNDNNSVFYSVVTGVCVHVSAFKLMLVHVCV